ncbi:MAG: type II toxin-antitoxin system VapC family toxin [Candidatus Pacebacteria bacterium]|nr:type II toxin-antitoxin system VapC family toxin [Candidatus Paceibacterota bacterium]
MIVLDTHALIWWVNDSGELSEKAQQSIKKAQVNNAIYISAISIWEISMLVKKGRLKLTMDVETWIDKVLSLPMLNCVDIIPKIAYKSVYLANFNHPDPADRMIIATALHKGMKLVTKDEKIQSYSNLETIW